MSHDLNEDDQLRSVTLQTARSVFLARQRAEEELVRAKEALWKQSEWLRVTLASIGDGVVTTDLEGRVLTLNGVAENLTGWMQQEAQGRPLVEVFRIINEETREPVENPAERALREGRVVGLVNHTILIARDGTETPIDDSAAPIRDDQGRVHGVVLIFRSIAERRQSEKALRQSERELADFFENASVGLHWVGRDGKILRVNQAELNLLGYSRSEYLGRHIAEFHADQDVIADILRRLSAGETLRDCEARMRCKDGSIKYVLIDSSVLWQDGKFVHSRGFTQDITDRKRAQEVQARLAAIVESSQDAIISKTLDSRIVSWNAAAEQLFGYTAGEVIGQPITLLIPPERQDEERVILERLRRGERIEHYETVRVSKQGRRIDVSLTISPITDSAGRIIGASKISRDITARKRAQQRLATQNGVTHTVAESASLREAAPKILQAICENLEWQVGALWYVSEHENVLRCVEMYHLPGIQVPHFEAISRERAFERGTGLPGRVWAEGNTVWIRDVVKDSNFARGAIADAEGLHGGFGFPIKLDDEAVGVMEFFSHEIRQPDDDLLQMMATIGSQVGQFIERKRAEEAVRESEERFRLLADHAPVLIWLDSPTGCVFVNRSYLDFLGLTAEEVQGMKWAKYVHPDDYDDYVGGYAAALEKRALFERELRFRRSDGVYRSMKTIGVPRFSAAGDFLGYIGCTYDITEIRRAEQALRDSEERFRLMADTVPSIIWTAAPDGAITYANKRWFEYCGLTPEQNAGCWPELVLHPEDRERCVAAWTAALEQGAPYEVALRNRRHDGAYRWFVTRAVPLRDAWGRIVQWFGATTDIDDRERAEQTTRFLADASAALAELTDHESTLQKVATLAVPHFADWCAVDVREADGSIRRLTVAHVDPDKIRLVRELDLEHPSRASESRGVTQVIRTGEPEWAASIPDEILVTLAHDEDYLRIIRSLGLKSYISVPLKSRTHVLGALTFGTTESGRAYDAEHVRAAEDLAHRAVIAIENETLLTTLKEADRRKDEFLAMLAHELRNPLAPIRNAVHIFRAKDPSKPELQSATEVIDRQVHQMTRLIDDLLDVSRITRGKIELRKELVDLATVVNSAVEASRPLIEKSGHQLTVTIPPQPIRLKADPTRLAQVLSNLLNNAAKYTDQGGRISVTGEEQGDHVVLRVKDNGVGIPAEMRPRIFDLFTQVGRSAERSEGGLGIGLTLVQRLVEMHGGTVEAQSDGPGKGSEFVVRLPVAVEGKDQGPYETAGGAKIIVPAACRILVVDDNWDAADSLGILLRTMGHEVHTAHDGLEAVGAAAAFRPDVVLLDIGLPKLSGYEVARRIREQDGGADLLLVALTGWGREEDRRRSKEAGFDHHMTKPVEWNTLQQLLAEISPDHSERRQTKRRS